MTTAWEKQLRTHLRDSVQQTVESCRYNPSTVLTDDTILNTVHQKLTTKLTDLSASSGFNISISKQQVAELVLTIYDGQFASWVAKRYDSSIPVPGEATDADSNTQAG